MLLSTSFLLALVTGYASASVTFYGNDPLLGDYVTCSDSTLANDTDLADLLALESPADSTREGTTFYYKVDLTCGSDYSYALSLQCTGLQGQPECHRRLQSRSRITANLRARRISSSPASTLSKRNAYYCKDASQTCDDTIDAGAFGTCPSGYQEIKVEAKGSVPGVICSKECTEAQKAECLASVCTYRRKQCAMYPANKGMCGDALIKCRYTKDPAISMKEEICNDNVLYGYDARTPGMPDCDKCVSFANSKCHLDNAAYDDWLAKNKAAADELMQGVLFEDGSGLELSRL